MSIMRIMLTYLKIYHFGIPVMVEIILEVVNNKDGKDYILTILSALVRYGSELSLRHYLRHY
jgi:hypothetical protein